MKTAISLPDPLFAELEALAAEMRVSRSALVARALRLFIRRERPASVTERLNTVYEGQAVQSEAPLVLAGWHREKNAW